MPVLNKWPQWPEFTLSDVPAQSEERMKGYKKAIVAEHGEQSLRNAWIKTCERLEQITQQLITEGSSIIPVLEYENLENLGDNEKQRMKELGCFVIRGVIPQDEVSSHYKSLKEYIASNKESISGACSHLSVIIFQASNLRYYSMAGGQSSSLQNLLDTYSAGIPRPRASSPCAKVLE